MGIIGNIATGFIVAATGSYNAVFLITALLYLTSFISFYGVLQGSRLDLGPLLRPTPLNTAKNAA